MKTIFEVIRLRQVRREVNHPMAGVAIHSPEAAAKFLMNEIGDDDREVLMVLTLNTKNEIIAYQRCHTGSLNASIVHPREVFRTAVKNGGASILVGHNHPSGDPSPSREDIAITQRLSEAGKILGIELLDHVVVGYQKYISLKEKGYV